MILSVLERDCACLVLRECLFGTRSPWVFSTVLFGTVRISRGAWIGQNRPNFASDEPQSQPITHKHTHTVNYSKK